MSDVRDILIRLLGEETISKMAGRAEKGLDKFGDSLEATEKDAADLDAQIGEVEASLRTLATAFARTSDAADRMDIAKAMRHQQAELRRLSKSRDLLPDFNNDEAIRFGGRLAAGVAAGLSRAGGAIAGALSNVFGTLPPQAQAAIGAGVVGAATTAAPLLGGVIASAVVGAAGTGGIIGGVVIASKHPAVQQSAARTGDLFSKAMHRAGVSFVPATLDALGQVQGRIGDIEDDFERAAAASSQMLRPLTGRVLDGAERAVDGFATAVQRSGPVVKVIGDIAARAGDMAGDAFEQLSGSAVEASWALRDMWLVIEVGVRGLVSMISILTETYGWMKKLSAVASGNRGELARLIAEEHNAKNASAELNPELAKLWEGLNRTGGAAGTATREVKSFHEQLKELHDQTLTVVESEIQFERALDETAEAAEKAKGGLDKKTEAGRKNWEVLTALVRDTKSYSAAVLERTGSEAEAAKVTEEGRKAFIAAAVQMGISEEAARDYANQLFGIPPRRDTKADFHPDNEGVRRWKKTLSGIDRHIFIKAEFDLINNKDVALALRLGRLSKGGPVVGSGPKGVDSAPYLLAPGEHVLTAAEVDAAGGHAGVEKIRAALRGEGGGAMPAMPGAPRPTGGGGGATVVNHYHITNQVSPGANLAEVGRVTVESIQAYEQRSGKGWRT